jgi:hypothetical protein
MNVTLEDFGTGWFGLSCGLKQNEVDFLISSLENLKKNPDQHFHAHSKFEGKGGIGDIQFCIVADDFKENMKFDGAK